MKTTTLKRKLALFVAILMALSLWTALPLTAWADPEVENDVSYIDEYGELQADDQGADNVTVITVETTELEDGWYIVSNDVEYDGRLTVNATKEGAHLILEDGYNYTVKGGIKVEGENKLTIYAQSTNEETMGTLDATGSNNDNGDAGIGGNSSTTGGTITINGGMITALGGGLSAGIGGGGQSDSGTITINGGMVNAIGGQSYPYSGAGIGGGASGDGGTITINGGTVIATGGKAGGGAGIGAGYSNPDRSSTITISGGTVIATGSSYGPGIGSYNSTNTSVVINGGMVTAKATGGENGTTSYSGIKGVFTLGGNAIVFATSTGTASAISDTEISNRTGGILFENGVGTMYDDVTITDDVTIPEGRTLTIPDGATLTVPEDKTLTNNGEITVETGGELIVESGGEIIDSGDVIVENDGTVTVAEGGMITVEDGGTLTGDGTLEIKGDEPLSLSLVTVTVNGTYIYNGSAQTLDLTVKIVGTPLTEGEDYTVATSDTDAGPATYTINGTGDYTGTKVGSFTIGKAVGDFGSPDPLPAVYSPTLTLANVEPPTNYAWNAPGTGVNAGDDQTFAATYIDPSGNYTSASGNITVNVAKATPSYIEPDDLEATYGDTLADVELTTGWTWEEESTTPVGDAGGQPHDATFTPGDMNNYNIVNDISLTISVAKADTSILTAPTAASIYRGVPLSASKLTGGEASVDGTFAWTDGRQTPAASGDFDVTFTPTDEANYNTADTTAHVTVIVPAPPQPTQYAVTVNNGDGGGLFAAEATVTISADAALSGKMFDRWTSEDVTFADASSTTTTFTMPAKAVTVTATYKDDPNAGGGDDPGTDNPPDNPPAADSDWVYEDGTWKYLVDGEVATGWIYDQSTWYYTNAAGEMQTGWVYDNNTWYYLAGNGAMKTGWLKDNGSWYYLKGDGAMKTGWLKDNGSWYYLKGDGAMVWGKWFKDTDGNWYYLSGNGKMLTGKQTIGGKAYTFKSNGAWIG
jgi:hypothetical protein